MTKPTARRRFASPATSRATKEEPASRLDELDRQIVRILQKDGRTSNTDIARTLGVTETTIRKRVAQLLDDDMMTIVAVPTPKAVGGSISALIALSVSPRAIHEVSQRLRSCREVRYVGMAAGRYDIMIDVWTEDKERLLEFVTETLGAIKGITNVETALILKVVKFSYEWEIV